MSILISEYQAKENYLTTNGWIRDRKQPGYWMKSAGWRSDTFHVLHTEEAFKTQRDWNLR